MMASQDDLFDWTTGGDPDLAHERRIDGGAFGDVHEVKSTSRNFLIVVDLPYTHW